MLHSLVLVRRPLPQLAEQGPSTNGDQLPSTGTNEQNHISCGSLVDDKPFLRSSASKLKYQDLPGQGGSPRQGTVSVSDPRQSLPPLDGGGLLHSLVLVTRPLPQLTEQAPSTNGDQLPLTRCDK